MWRSSLPAGAGNTLDYIPLAVPLQGITEAADRSALWAAGERYPEGKRGARQGTVTQYIGEIVAGGLIAYAAGW